MYHVYGIHSHQSLTAFTAITVANSLGNRAVFNYDVLLLISLYNSNIEY